MNQTLDTICRFYGFNNFAIDHACRVESKGMVEWRVDDVALSPMATSDEIVEALR